MVRVTVPPEVSLDAIEAGTKMRRGRMPRIDPLVEPEADPRLKRFSSRKFEMIRTITADRRIKPDSYARVAVAILQHVNQYTYEAFPSQKTIAAEAAVSVSTVKKAISHLAELGYFAVGKHKRGGRYLFQRHFFAQPK